MDKSGFSRLGTWHCSFLFGSASSQLTSDGEAVYFCGNSLGLLSKRGRELVMQELDTWSTS